MAGLQLLLILSCIQGILLFARLRGRDSVDTLCNATKLDQSHLLHRLLDFGFVLINVLLLIKPKPLVCGSPNPQIHRGENLVYRHQYSPMAARPFLKFPDVSLSIELRMSLCDICKRPMMKMT